MLYKKIYNDVVNDKYSILIDEDSHLQFCYWRQHFQHGWHHWDDDRTFDIKKTTTDKHEANSRGLLIAEMAESAASIQCGTQYQQKHIGQNELESILTSQADSPCIFIECTFDRVHIEQLSFSNQVAFLGCQFKEDIRFIKCVFSQDVFFSNSIFKKQFSVKGSTVLANIHLEGANFSGQGGASFRRLTAQNLYLDFSVQGPNDITWLNEMNISGVISLGGCFKSEIELDTDQDNTGHSERFTIGSLFIGVDLYHAEHSNRTIIENKLSIKGYAFSQNIQITKFTANFLEIGQISANRLSLHDIESVKDVTIEQCRFFGQKSIDLTESSIGRHLKVSQNIVGGYVNLSGSAVSENSYFEHNQYDVDSKLDLRKFTSSRFLVVPEESLYNHAPNKLFSPKPFSLVELDTQAEEQSSIYCSLKHWLADAGKLDMEDSAYFHMRDNQPHRLGTKLLLGRVFGWGIRLTNIAIFSLAIVALFAVLYSHLIAHMSVSQAIALSFQSFISSFFGQWQSFSPGGLVATIVTFESILGVFFITVFVGAYIRKLLR